MAHISKFRLEVPEIVTFFEDDEGYDAHIATWNTYTQRRPLGVTLPTTPAQVSAIIKAAKSSGITQIAVRGGGHSFEGLGLGGTDGALVIDVIHLDKITSDPSNDVLTAGGGSMLGAVALFAWEHGEKMLPMGTRPSVGLGGQIQCGGYGFYSRTFGTLTDRVIDLEIVTPDGEIRHANEKKNPELFFAVRGSGAGSFGVITSITLRTNDAPPAVGSFSMKWNLREHDIPKVLKDLHMACVDAPLSVNPMMVIWLGVLEVSGVILAQSLTERGLTWEDFKSRLPMPDEATFTPLSFIDTVADIELKQTSAPWYQNLSNLKREGREHERFMKIKAGFVPKLLQDDFLRRLGDLALTQPTSGVRLQLLGLNANWKPNPDTTSIKVRGCPWLMGMSVWLPVEEYGKGGVVTEARRRLPWLTKAYELFYPLTNGGYLGDDDYDEALHGRDMMQSYYGHHLNRLRRVKAQYDPANLFHHPLSIPPS